MKMKNIFLVVNSTLKFQNPCFLTLQQKLMNYELRSQNFRFLIDRIVIFKESGEINSFNIKLILFFIG
jgi:hypothetical protein